MPRAKQTALEKARIAKRHVIWHYYSNMPQHKGWRILLWVLFFGYALITAGQLLYPLDRALPRASLFGEQVGWQKHETIAARLTEQFQTTKIELATGSRQEQYLLASAGAELSSDEMSAQTRDYPFWQRFIPLSILWPVQVTDTEIHYTDHILNSFSQKQSQVLTTKPVNAQLTIKDGQLVAVSDKPGATVTAQEVAAAIKEARIVLGKTNTITPQAKLQPAAVTSGDFAAVKTKAETALGRGVVIVADSQEFRPTSKQVAGWLAIGQDAKKQPTLSVDPKKVHAYLNTIDQKVAVRPGVTQVTLTDGQETARKAGSKGRAITREPLIGELSSWVLDGVGGSLFTASFHEIAPTVAYNRIYTPSQAGVRAYLNDVAARMDVRVALQQIGGNGWSASVRSGESLPSASTYKLYIAKWLFTQMDKGKIKWSDPMLGTTVSGCFDQMTIASTNACAEEWLRQIGRENMNNFVYGLGFSTGTSFTNAGATTTTPNDLRKYMIGLNNGSLVGGAHRDRLLHSLSVHPYRQGIPAGSGGMVYDKVGFLWSYVHDAAIVKHPRGTYVMVVMTNGQSYGRIAEITRQVERLMYP